MKGFAMNGFAKLVASAVVPVLARALTRTP
jgi:hypothetical protein